MTTPAFELANILPTEPPTPGYTLVVENASPLDMDWTAMTSGGAFVPAATAQGQGLVSGPSPDFAWSIGVSGIPEPPTGATVYGRSSGTWDPVLPLAGGTMTGLLTLGVSPTNPMDAATKGYADQKVAKSGDIMTGPLVLAADPTVALGAATKEYVDLPVDCGTY